MIIFTERLIRSGYAGFAFFPFVFLRKRYRANERMIRHERIHLRQQAELLVVGFYLLYFGEYLMRRLRTDSWHEAYRSISFEREAYAHDREADYLQQRKSWAWRRYL